MFRRFVKLNVPWMVAACLFEALPAQAETLPLSLPVQPRQMVLVVTPDWQAVNGQLQRYELDDQTWRPVGQKINVVVGRNGLGWGAGLHPMPEVGPQKHEGDGRSCAGVFALRYAFGYAPPEKVPGIKIPYVQCTTNLECVDDTNSSHYNQLVDRATVPNPDWRSSEKMLMKNGQYRLGIVVEHNTSPPVPGGGSCIFLHIWLGPGIGTAGCTAMREGDIETLVAWIDATASPVLVQLPEPEYQRLKKPWRLPDLPALQP